jgi:hypothetical protein
MGIFRYWCPKHHIARTNTVPEKVIFDEDAVMYADWRASVGVVKYETITPVCPICREKMVYAGSHMPKKKKGKK